MFQSLLYHPFRPKRGSSIQNKSIEVLTFLHIYNINNIIMHAYFLNKQSMIIRYLWTNDLVEK